MIGRRGRANKPTEFNAVKLRYLINEHYDSDTKKQTLINALNSFKEDCKEAKPAFYVRGDTLTNTKQCIAFFKVPKTQTKYMIYTNEAVYVQTSDNTPDGEIIGVYYAKINIGQESGKAYDIRCYYLKDKCYDEGVKELCGKVGMKLTVEGGGFANMPNKACLSITGEKNLDFLHDVNARLGESNNLVKKQAYVVKDETYVRMFIKKDEENIEMQEFNTKFTIKYKQNGSTWDSVKHKGLTEGEKAPQPIATKQIQNDNYQNPVMRDNNATSKGKLKEYDKLDIINKPYGNNTGNSIGKTDKIIIINRINEKYDSNNEKSNKNNNKGYVEESPSNDINVLSKNISKNIHELEQQNKELKNKNAEYENLMDINDKALKHTDTINEKLQQTIKNLKKEISDLKQQNHMLQIAKNNAKANWDEAKKQNNELTETITSQTKEINELQRKNKRLNEEKEKLKKEFNEKKEQLNKELNDEEEKLNKQLNDEKEKLKKELNEKKEQLKEEFNKKNNEIAKQLYNQYQKEIDKLKEENKQQQMKH